MGDLSCIGLFLPLVGFLVLIAFSRLVSHRWAGLIGCSTLFLSLCAFTGVLLTYSKGSIEHENITLFQWIPIQGINADFTLHVDALAILMALIITGVGFLIHVYSIGYMEHDTDVVRYFAFMNFFVFSMLLLVLAGHLLLLFVGWEGVGLASYLLIGFWYERPAAVKAATKAFIINRIGDLGLLIGLLLTFFLFGTGDIEEVSRRAVQDFAVGAPIITLLTLLFFFGATGKSAQLPLYTWLPDAMEGPTPVSALIHAATMVTAGVYLIVRMHAVFMLAPTTLYIIGSIGGVTALFAALCATAQTDLKRVLAYSTISQLGLMFLACGVGAFYAAMFHLTTHAFIKSLLFLSAGNVVHMLHGTTEMSKMGGLAKMLPKTHYLFLIGTFALSGIPPLAAFFSKDLILELEYLAGFKLLFYIALTASILTAFYLFLAYCLTFLGSKRSDEKITPLIQEAPAVMIAPVSLLAFLSIVGGFLGFSFGSVPILETFLYAIGITAEERRLTTAFVVSPEMIMSVIGALLGASVGFVLYTRSLGRESNPIKLFQKSFYVNEIYYKGIVIPLKKVSDFIVNKIEPHVFDGAVASAVEGTRRIATWMQGLQSGLIRSYAAWLVLGSVFVIIYIVSRS
jgi:NADH-quinone oxidoreductase subunit L